MVDNSFSHYCFVAGTEVLTVDGIKSIEDIQVGDWVIADDPTTPGGIEARQVLETFVRETDGLVDLYVDGEVISTTGEHPFWVPDKGWVEAKDLVVGSLLQTADGRVVDVDKVERREGKFPVYNFKVEGIPTYFVSELGILVHNASYPDPPLNLQVQIPNERLLAKPRSRGQAPIGSDGFPVELHHTEQTQDGLIDEMTRTDHRLGDNYDLNHSNTGGEDSLIDRKQFKRQKQKYWAEQWDSGRFDDLPEP